MRAIGKTIWQMEKAGLFIQMVMYMRASGRMIKLMERECIFIWMGQNIVENGKRINSMVLVKRLGQMVQSTKVIMNMVRNMEQGHLSGQIRVCMWENSTTTISRGRESTPGATAGSTRENGSQTKCTARAPSGGQTAGGT